MFKLNENIEVDRKFLKCDYIRYSPAETSTINTRNSHIYFYVYIFINLPIEDFVICFLSSYLDLNFDVIKKTDSNRYGDGIDISLIISGPIALSGNFNLTASPGKHLEDYCHAHIFSLMYKLITSAKYSDDLCVGFDRDRGRS